MPTTVGVAFPWGRYHATPWGRNVNEGAVEWPPSPWRILRALYATWQARAPHLDQQVVLALLDALAEAPEYQLPPHVEAHTRHYMPRTTHMKGRPAGSATTDYSDGATDMAVDAFAVLERDAELIVRWPVDLPEVQRAALAELVELLPYLGRAESICEARLLEDRLPEGTSCRPLGAESQGDARAVRLLVPERPLAVEALTATTSHVRARLRRVDPPGASWVDYERPEPVVPERRRPDRLLGSVEAIRWSIAAAARPSRKAAVAMTDALRSACMGQFGRRFDSARSPTLAGKDAQGRKLEGHGHAHYLAFTANVRPSRAAPLDTFVLWAPAGLGEEEMRALAELRSLMGFAHARDFRPCRLGLEAYGPIAQVAPELVAGSTVWESHTPFSPPRHAKRRTSWLDHVVSQVGEELTRREKATPARIEVLAGDWSAYRTHRHTKNERLANARRATGVRLTFDQPIEGPLVIGALSHFGLGLFLPSAERLPLASGDDACGEARALFAAARPAGSAVEELLAERRADVGRGTS